MRHLLLEACEFNWDAISPAIFGSLFQSVMKPVERRRAGAHYTTEKNIPKVIQPLFLDELNAEFNQLCDRRDSGRRTALLHRTFAWGSDAHGMAHVHVVIIGLTTRASEPPIKRLFSYDDISGDPVESQHAALTPYLFDAANLTDRHLVVREISKPLCDVSALLTGCQPIDDGQYIFDAEQRREFLRHEPAARNFMRPFIGANEFLYNEERWILALQNATPADLRSMPHVRERIANVRAFRRNSQRASTLKLAATPTQFQVTVIPDTPFLVIPEVSSENREYVPIAWLHPPAIPSNLVRVLTGATLWHFGILTSRMHMAWIRYIGGRLKSDLRYSVGVVYNPFPWPTADEHQRQRIVDLAQEILNVRAQSPESSLADLYDVDAMTPALSRAHHALDAAVDKLYRPTAFTSDRERVEHLFKLYEGLVMPPLAPIVPDSPRPRRSRIRRTAMHEM